MISRHEMECTASASLFELFPLNTSNFQIWAPNEWKSMSLLLNETLYKKESLSSITEQGYSILQESLHSMLISLLSIDPPLIHTASSLDQAENLSREWSENREEIGMKGLEVVMAMFSLIKALPSVIPIHQAIITSVASMLSSTEFLKFSFLVSEALNLVLETRSELNEEYLAILKKLESNDLDNQENMRSLHIMFNPALILISHNPEPFERFYTNTTRRRLLTHNTKGIEIEQKEIDLAIRKQFPDGNIKTADDLKMTLTMLKDTLTDKQNEKADKTAQMEAAKQAQQVQIARVEDEEEYQVERAQKLSLNSLVATVVAVNREWGFVMVNAGRAHGVEPDSSLLVKRGNLRVGRLRIVSLEDMMTVADVVDENGVSGITVKPGDKVIFESTN